MTTKREQTRQRRRDELAAIAYAEVAAKGLEGLRVRDVAAAAGINHATLLHYFPTKSALLDAIIDHLLAQFMTPAAGPRPASGQSLAAVLTHELDDIQARLRHTPEIFAVLTDLQGRSLRDPAVRASLDRLDAAWTGYLAGLIRAGIEAGECYPDVDPESAAALLAAIFRGVSLQAALGRPEDIGWLLDQAGLALRGWLVPPGEVLSPGPSDAGATSRDIAARRP